MDETVIVKIIHDKSSGRKVKRAAVQNFAILTNN